jgi:erythromycin esterase
MVRFPRARLLLVVLLGLPSACAFPTGELTRTPLDFAGLPQGWGGGTSVPKGVGVTGRFVHGGSSAAYMTSAVSASAATSSGPVNVVLTQIVRADDYRGKRVRWSGWLRAQNVTDATAAGLWMRVDGPHGIEAFDNMSTRPVVGTTEWVRADVVLDVPPTAIGIALGALFAGKNTLFVDDLTLEVVDASVATTAIATQPNPSFPDSAALVATYSRARTAPVNADFEGVLDESASSAAWLRQNTVSLTTTDAAAALDDLAPLRAMIGAATVVGLGEGTHGTREFHTLRHRMVRFLVAEMGFTEFAIEATAPEAEDLNRYVLGGPGDPVALLSRLFFWTVRDQEVLDLIAWMREWNASAAPDRQVHFHGFDIQYPGASIDTVLAYLSRTAPADSSGVGARYACLDAYRNRGATFGVPVTVFPLRPDSTKAACARTVQEAVDFIGDRRPTYAAISGDSTYAAALHAAQLVVQYEGYAERVGNSAAGNVWRDRAMADNVRWLLDHAAPGARMILWAHNQHIGAVPGWMGGNLRDAYGANYVALGTTFGTGSVTAVSTATSDLASFNVAVQVQGSVEQLFDSAAVVRGIVDMRRLRTATGVSTIRGPIYMRSIGSTFFANLAVQTLFPADFDLVVYLKTGTAVNVLPFTP